MSGITWKPVYETQIITLDTEHKRLVGQINRLYQMILDKGAEADLLSIFDELVDYTDKHFSHEERLLGEYGYPQLDMQKTQHLQLRQQVLDYRKQLVGGAVVPAAEVMGFLRNWLLDHIVNHDKQYGPYLESRGGRFVE